MKVVLQLSDAIPATNYGGVNRVVWALGQSLVKLGHEVVFLAPKSSYCSFATIIEWRPKVALKHQLPKVFDIVHLHSSIKFENEIPTIHTIHGYPSEKPLPKNACFVSRAHAALFGSETFVHNGLDWSEVQLPNFKSERTNFHFLAKAAWQVKNLQGALLAIKQIEGARLDVLGGHRFNFHMGFRFTLTPKAKFWGMVGNATKYKVLSASRGLIFPVLWHEPFGLAVIESLYMGCPVFGTPYGSLPEIITSDYGFLTDSAQLLVQAMLNAHTYDAFACHEYAKQRFHSDRMALSYLALYKKVISGESLNSKNPQLQQNPRGLPWQ